jgi:predicted enzyme related to lactoylglutathione lyase
MTAFIYNVTFDANDPRTLGRFWAAVTGYRIELEDDATVSLRAPDERGLRRILFMRVDDATPGKNRMHVDLAARDPDGEIDRLLDLGAQLVDSRVDGQPSWRGGDEVKWVVLQDPEGNEFCIG